MPRLRRLSLLSAIAGLLLLVSAPAIAAEQQGPLKVKTLPPRPPKSGTHIDERPELKRSKVTPDKKKSANLSACPAGYIPKPTSDDDEKPPRLRRGKPGQQSETNSESREETPECVQATEPVPRQGDLVKAPVAPQYRGPFLERVRQEASAFSVTLPDFICEQSTDREISRTNPPHWTLEDRITAELLYVDGKEDYRNFRRNGKKLEGHPEDSGVWSTGEFGTLLRNLFSPGSNAEFRYRERSEIEGVNAKVYDYSVQQTNSRWRVELEGRVLYPAYKGSVWVDPESARVLRIEMLAPDIPADYPLDTIELTVDYGSVRIGEREYVLATRSENLSCQRGTRFCNRNEIEFRNYRKFTVESTITTTDSTIDYAGKAPPGTNQK